MREMREGGRREKKIEEGREEEEEGVREEISSVGREFIKLTANYQVFYIHFMVSVVEPLVAEEEEEEQEYKRRSIGSERVKKVREKKREWDELPKSANK